MGQITDLQKQVFANKIKKGFNTTDVQTEFLLTYGELGEAYDAWRMKQPDVGEEIADIMIYCLGLSEVLGINIETEIITKIAKNARRTYVKKDGVLLKEEV